jgi:hypothetical protein
VGALGRAVAIAHVVLGRIQTGRWPYGRLRELLPDEWRKTAPASALRDPKR